jgi:hypothetical protein
MKTREALALLGLLALLAAACSGSGLAIPQGNEGGVCYPDDTCNAGLVCTAGVCLAACSLGDSQGCQCADGGEGLQTCLADGRWSACTCSESCGDGVGLRGL